MATNEMRRNEQGERMKDTQWHNVIAWGSVAELVEKRLSRGSEVAIEGKLVSHSYLDKEGKKRYVTEVVVNELLLLEKKTSV